MALADIILADSPVAYWKCYDALASSVLADSSGNGHNGTIRANSKAGAAGFRGIAATALRCFGGGSNEGAEIPYNATLRPAVGSFEICLAGRQRINQSVTLWAQIGSGTAGYLMSLNHSGGIWTPELRLGSGGGSAVIGTAGLSDLHHWHHLVFTWDFTDDLYKIFLDGTDISGTSGTLSVGAPTGNFTFVQSDFNPLAVCHSAIYSTELVQADVDERWEAVQEERYKERRSGIYFGLHDEILSSGTEGGRESRFSTLANDGLKLMRAMFRWDILEPTEGAYDWTRLDSAINHANTYDIQLIWCVRSSPLWANGGADQFVIPGTGVDATFIAWVDEYKNFMNVALGRIKPDGTGTYRLRYPHIFEFWNEPNLHGFWSCTGDVNPDQYAYFYSEVSAVILSHIPGARIMIGATASWNASSGSPNMAGSTWAQGVVDSIYFNDIIDIYSHHPYPVNNDPDSVAAGQNHFNDMLQIKDFLCLNGHPNAILACTEQGATNDTSETDCDNKTVLMAERMRDEWGNFIHSAAFFVMEHSSYESREFYNTVPTDGAPSTDRKGNRAILLGEIATAMFQGQLERPSSDITDGTWQPSTGVDLYAMLDEVETDLADYIYSSDSPASADISEVKFTTADDPDYHGDHYIRYTYAKNADIGDQIDLTVRLIQGTTIIASWEHLDIGDAPFYADQELTEAQAAAITDYSDLRLRFEAIKAV